MESGQNLKRRMKSVQNIGQITKAMELVEATKMRKSQELALGSRPYAYTALEMLGVLSSLKARDGKMVPMPEILRERPIEKTAFLLMTSDKGLAGSFNSSVFRKFENYVRTGHIDLHDQKYSFMAVGQKAKSYLEHRGIPVSNAFNRMGDIMTMAEAEPISEALVAGYLNHDFDEVILFSTNFVNALRQEVFIRQILPVSFEKIQESIRLLIPESGKYSQYLSASGAPADENGQKKDIRYIIEPSATEVLNQLAPLLLKIRVYHAILEANASEHSARRVAMKNASDNASELSEKLTMIYNKSRQAAITSQIIEVTSGAQAAQN
jgi:F-type H+-transporting ATPase subunit gamma